MTELYEIKKDKWYNGYFVRGYNECVSDTIMPLLHEQVNWDGHFQFKKIGDEKGHTMLEIRNQKNTNAPFILVGSVPPQGSTEKPRLKTIFKSYYEQIKENVKNSTVVDKYSGSTLYPYLWLKTNEDIAESNPKNQVYFSFFSEQPFVMKDINPENGEFMIKEGSIMNKNNIRTPLSIRYYPITGKCECPKSGEGANSMGCDLRTLFSNYHNVIIPDVEIADFKSEKVELPKVEKEDEKDDDEQDNDDVEGDDDEPEPEDEGDMNDKKEDDEESESFWGKYKWWVISSVSAFILFVIVWMVIKSRSSQ